MSLSFWDSVLGGTIKVNLVAYKHLDGWVGLLIDLNPLLHILETLPLRYIKHVDSGSTPQGIAEGILSITDTTGDLPIIDSVYGFLFTK